MKQNLKAQQINKNLQKYMFMNNNLNLLLDNKNLSINKFNNTKVSEKNTNDFFLPNENDTLFWCFYYIKYGEIPLLHTFKKEKDFKIKFVELIRNNKELIKSNKLKIYEIEDELVNGSKISKKTLLILCKYYEINILLIEGNIYYKLLGNDIDDIKHVITCDNSNYQTKFIDMESIDNYINNKLEAYSLTKVIKSVSAYKLFEIKEMANKLNITNVTKNKNKLYEDIMLKLS